MEQIFRPQRNVIIMVTANAYGLAIAFTAILIYAGNAISTLIVPIVVIVCLFSCFPLLFLLTKLVVTDDTLALTIIPPFTMVTKISDIASVNYRSQLIGGIDSYEIKYRGKSGKYRKIRITTNAYGSKEVKQIISILKDRNHNISLDHETATLLHS